MDKTLQKKLFLGALIFLVLLVVLVRLPMLFYGLPFDLGDEDENGFIGCALNYGASRTIIPILNYYPAFFSYILAVLFGVYYLLSLLIGNVLNIYDFALQYLLYPGYFHFIGRFVSIIFSSASVVALYLCGKEYKDSLTGLIAAVLFTFSTTVLWRTSWALPDSTYILMTILSIYFILRFLRGRGNRNISLGGLFCGLAISTKYNVGTLMAVGFMAIILGYFTEGNGTKLRENLGRIFKDHRIYYYLSFVIIGFLVGSPYWIIDIQNNIAALRWEIGRLSAEEFGSSFYLSRIPYIWIFSEMIIRETGLGLLVIITFGYALYRSMKGDRSFQLFVPYLILSVIMIGGYQKHSLHYLFPAFPAFMLVAGKAMSDIFQKSRTIVIVTTVVLLIILIFPVYHTLTYSSLFLRKDTRLAARTWILKNIPFGSVIAVGRTIHAPPLPDINRFNKKHYSMYSEQVLSQKLPESIKKQYLLEIKDQSYYVTNYVVKRSFGRQESYSSMMADFDILKYDEISPKRPEYLIFTSRDISYLHSNGYKNISDVPGLSSTLNLEKLISPKTENLRGPDIWIFAIKPG